MSIILNGTTGITTPSVNSGSSEFLVSAPANGGALVLVGNDTGGTEVRLAMQNVTGSEAFRPFNSTSDARFNLGASSRRWKDLYLSGGVYVGGTGSANHLDDYEEGTWTPALSFGAATTGITYSIQSGAYVKVGGQVTVWAQIALSNRGSATGAARVTGLPFTNVNAPGRSEGATAAFNFWVSMAGAPIPLGYVQNNNTTIYLINGVASNSSSTLVEANFSNSSSVYFNATYSTV